MSEPTGEHSATPPKRKRFPKTQLARGMKMEEAATTAPLAADDQDQQAAPMTELATSPALTGSPKSPSASGTKKSKQHSATLSRPRTDDQKEWEEYWTAQGQPWRTEPEIAEWRKDYLTEQLGSGDTVPFAGIKLNRADVEWLLATHENGLGPVDWRDTSQQDREGLNLWEANLSEVNLSGLPLTNAKLNEAHLEHASLMETHMEGANLFAAHLERAFILSGHLEHAFLLSAHLEEAILSGAYLKQAILVEAHLEGTDLTMTHLEGCNFCGASMDVRTRLTDAVIDTKMQVADVVWNGVPLIRLNWIDVPVLGDELDARLSKNSDRKPKDEKGRLVEYQAAERANRQLAVALRGQGLNEIADRFSYRAQLCQRVVFRLQRHWLKYAFSWFLAILTGYGFRMWRIIVGYIVLILAFALAYWGFGVHQPRDISFWTAIIISVTAFHGRVFSNPFTPDVPDVQVIVTAIETVCGLIVEALFVAMLVQRFFSR